MSDGPHRSLPMRRHWKDLAERAEKAAFSADQVCEAVPYALKKDFAESPLEAVRNVLCGDGQGLLFPSDRTAQLEALRAECRGSAGGNTLIDCAVEAIANGLTGDTACKSALENALQDHTRNSFRSVEEHYQREASARSTGYVRERLDAARRKCDFGALASELVSPEKPSKARARPPKRSGIDEGPQL